MAVRAKKALFYTPHSGTPQGIPGNSFLKNSDRARCGPPLPGDEKSAATPAGSAIYYRPECLRNIEEALFSEVIIRNIQILDH
jgi:hypothetical protein